MEVVHCKSVALITTDSPGCNIVVWFKFKGTCTYVYIMYIHVRIYYVPVHVYRCV